MYSSTDFYLFIVCICAKSAIVWGFQPCHIEPDQTIEFILDESHRPEQKYKGVQLPTSLDWRCKDGQRYTTWTRNQHIPNYCGSCWAMSATSALADRIMVQNKNEFPEWNLAPQVLLNCETEDMGCHGGYPSRAYEYIRKHGIPSETCQAYTATGWDTGNSCNDIDICMNCVPGDSDTGCFAQFPHQLWFVTEHGIIKGETAMIQALQDGPITCGMQVTQQFEALVDYCGVYKDPCEHCLLQDHDISIVGYGTEHGLDYWIIRNSWGTYWGCDGYVRIVRGINNLGLEMACAWAYPSKQPIWVNGTKPLKKKEAKPKSCHIEPEFYIKDFISSPLPCASNLPTSFTWADYNGTNLLTTARNQHIPHYCGSCWAFATTSSLSDRLNIIRYQAGERLFPEINLSPQVLVNVDGGGSCNGGSPEKVYAYIKENGVPDETCQNYQAMDSPHGNRTELNICENCVPGGTCSPVNNFTLYYVSEYSGVSGSDGMKQEIYGRGPISCLMDATSQFHAYAGGIFSQNVTDPPLNHVISILGWGRSADGEDYWIGRNSWGTYWGEQGFFRIKMQSDNLGIETACSWGVPLWK